MFDDTPFTPKWLQTGEPETWPSLRFQMASLLERDQFEAELEGRYRAGQVYSFQLLEIAVTGIRALMPGDDGEALIELVRADYAAQLGDGKAIVDALSPMEKTQVNAATDVLAEHWPEYRVAVEQETRRTAILPTLAFMRWCIGWERLTDDQGVEIAYSRDARGDMPEAALRRIPRLVLRAAGIEAYQRQYGRGAAKNSAPPSN